MSKGKPTYMNAPIDLYGHIDEQGARYKKSLSVSRFTDSQLLGKSSVSDMEAVSFTHLLAFDECFGVFLTDAG